ncbi:hypothetical protein [Sphingomonas lacusdianchii]|uniref:hypothetical protein n=1 Tax=Sphingomonas lacusdianchii TaxID=2917992 RepID=UPI001F55D29D|nr:hypothetical protein [Sphingomonas sp. JXJ CY 53]
MDFSDWDEAIVRGGGAPRKPERYRNMIRGEPVRPAWLLRWSEQRIEKPPQTGGVLSVVEGVGRCRQERH